MCFGLFLFMVISCSKSEEQKKSNLFKDAPVIRVETGLVLAEVSKQFLSFAVDTSQVVGGNWWSPKGVTEKVDPYDFSRLRLKNMAKALSPAYFRIGGTEADNTFYNLSDPYDEKLNPKWEEEALILKKKMVDDFCTFAVEQGLDLFFTLNGGRFTHNEKKVWQPENSGKLIQYIKSIKCPVKVWEFGNEINGYWVFSKGKFRLSGKEYAESFKLAKALIDKEDPDSKLAGPSSAYWPKVGEAFPVMPTFLENIGDKLDIITWHYYPQQSTRCPTQSRKAELKLLLNPKYLDEINKWAEEVEQKAKKHNPKAQIWLGETGHAQCGGAQGISGTYVSSLWWLDELGTIAKRGQPVIIRQTLTGGDYQMIDEQNLNPLPDYFASLLWKKLMGQKVFKVQKIANKDHLRFYAHCSKKQSGALTLLAINLHEKDSEGVQFKGLGDSHTLYGLNSTELKSKKIYLNAKELKVDSQGRPPEIKGKSAKYGVELAPLSSTFIEFPNAKLELCE